MLAPVQRAAAPVADADGMLRRDTSLAVHGLIRATGARRRPNTSGQPSRIQS